MWPLKNKNKFKKSSLGQQFSGRRFWMLRRPPVPPSHRLSRLPHAPNLTVILTHPQYLASDSDSSSASSGSDFDSSFTTSYIQEECSLGGGNPQTKRTPQTKHMYPMHTTIQSVCDLCMGDVGDRYRESHRISWAQLPIQTIHVYGIHMYGLFGHWAHAIP
jgi:hypothetical protein